jgi:hypothetical protein
MSEPKFAEVHPLLKASEPRNKYQATGLPPRYMRLADVKRSSVCLEIPQISPDVSSPWKNYRKKKGVTNEQEQ